MYSAMKEMCAVNSGTGVFYQAMPAVGADGKNIMKLIPVQMVNGQFVQTQMSKPKTDPTLHKAVASAPVPVVKEADFNHSETQQVVRKPVSLMNVLQNQPDKHPLQQKTGNLMGKVAPSIATTATNCEKPIRVSSQFPVTVKSPALPRGQYLQIPPHAQVRRVPASELPVNIKKKIFTSSPSPSPGSDVPSVVYVSPITTVNQGVTPPNDSALHSLKLLSKASSKTSCGPLSKGSQKHLKLVPTVSQRPNSPIKWRIEEEDSSTARTLDPLNSPSVTSEILLALAERENASKSVSQLSQGKSGQDQENALVVCNGKVYFVAKKCSMQFKTVKNDSSVPANKSYEVNKTMVPSSRRSLESVASELQQDDRIIISDESDDVIDLCDDDDTQDDSSQQAASVNMSAITHLDEDNVIFVSYIPPKSKSDSAQGLVLGKETDQLGTSSSNSVKELTSLDGTTAGDDRDDISALRGKTPGHDIFVNTVRSHTDVFGSADNEGLNVINSQQSTCTQQLESMEADVDTESSADPSASDSSSRICSQIEEKDDQMESSTNPATTSLLEPKSCQMADHVLRRIFKITADVKICLQRIDEASAGLVPAEPLQSECVRLMEDHQEPMSRLKHEELILQDLYSPEETDSGNGFISIKLMKVETEQKLSADPSNPSPHTCTGPLKCPRFKLSTNPLSALKCNSGQSSLKGTSCDVDTEPVIGYVEPIDEDILSTDENDIPNSQDTDAQPQTPSCVDLNTNTRRMGRTRKRTVCRCCIPGSHVPAVKSSAKSVEPEKWVWTTEQMSIKGGRTKAVRKDVKTSGRISCLIAKSKQKCKTFMGPASSSLPTTPMDSDELQRHEQIRRLEELLEEKEAGLEVMKNSSS
uniref:ligand-dependent nuclear receptor-interacting factor 1 n=1 Tax=Scatophagus argus TaxID=75038 RepID=UPI001ED7F563|nr:ligand-dependent nuclear receptor-interacting factor 1 [Scatophagus argus]